ncbi:MAG: hypothetical protein ACOYW9_09875 [Deinococcota bacterium]
MPFQIVKSKEARKLETVEIFGNPVPKIESFDDFPFEARTEAQDLFAQWQNKTYDVYGVAIRLMCIATQLNPRPKDRYTYDRLKTEMRDADPEFLKAWQAQVIEWASQVFIALGEEAERQAREPDPNARMAAESSS